MQEKSDVQLLRDYAERGTETAFREIVQRHTDLIYSAALRQVTSPDLARDVAQSVFTDLARKASSLAATLPENASLLGWLYRSTRYVALNQIRDDRRRQTRERQAMENFDPASETNWGHLQPVLDEAMADLSDGDREALLLRFFKNHDFRAIGTTLGVSDDTAQKRVSRALEKLRGHLTRRKVTMSAIALSAMLSANAVQAAPIGLAATLSTAALSGTVISTATAIATTKTIAMTTLQKTFIAATVAVAVGTGIYEANKAATLQRELHILAKSREPLTDEIQRLQREGHDATNRLAALTEEAAKAQRSFSELLKSRGEVARLKTANADLAAVAGDPLEAKLKKWSANVKLLKQYLTEHPEAEIPEFKLLDDFDWLAHASRDLNEEKDFRQTMSQLRGRGENNFANECMEALRLYAEEHRGAFPRETLALKPYFKGGMDDAILNRWGVFPADEAPDMRLGGKHILAPKTPVDEEFDRRYVVGAGGHGSTSWKKETEGASEIESLVLPAIQAYTAANGGKRPAFATDLRPYIAPEKQAILDDLIRHGLQLQKPK